MEELPCGDKVAFDSKELAQAAALLAERDHGVRLRVYICRFCGLWHLASL